MGSVDWIRELVIGMVAAMVGLLLLTQISIEDNFKRILLPGTVVVGFGIVTDIVTVSLTSAMCHS